MTSVVVTSSPRAVQAPLHDAHAERREPQFGVTHEVEECLDARPVLGQCRELRSPASVADGRYRGGAIPEASLGHRGDCTGRPPWRRRSRGAGSRCRTKVRRGDGSPARSWRTGAVVANAIGPQALGAAARTGRAGPCRQPTGGAHSVGSALRASRCRPPTGGAHSVWRGSPREPLSRTPPGKVETPVRQSSGRRPDAPGARKPSNSVANSTTADVRDRARAAWARRPSLAALRPPRLMSATSRWRDAAGARRRPSLAALRPPRLMSPTSRWRDAAGAPSAALPRALRPRPAAAHVDDRRADDLARSRRTSRLHARRRVAPCPAGPRASGPATTRRPARPPNPARSSRPDRATGPPRPRSSPRSSASSRIVRPDLRASLARVAAAS